ncbi:unnamed protein product [Rotaria sp. Silwood1]|nr:unnamed protein product [Rotaria sp. Silwood1]
MDEEPRKWPDLVGKDGKEAVEIIKRDTGFTQVHVVPPNAMVTMDYRLDRVRVHVNEQGKVAYPPTVDILSSRSLKIFDHKRCLHIRHSK